MPCDSLQRTKGLTSRLREVEEVNQMCIRDGRCHLCAKGCYNDPSDGHLKSQGHQEKVKEEALCNRLFGKSQTFRRLDSHGCRTKSKRAMRNYWGAEVENLGHLARQLVYEESRVIFYKWGKVKLCKDTCHHQGESASGSTSRHCDGTVKQESMRGSSIRWKMWHCGTS